MDWKYFDRFWNIELAVDTKYTNGDSVGYMKLLWQTRFETSYSDSCHE